MKWNERITVDPKILVGKPIVKDTRISVEFVIDLLAGGWSHQDILQDYPQLAEQDILACLDYAANMLKSERVYLKKAS